MEKFLSDGSKNGIILDTDLVEGYLRLSKGKLRLTELAQKIVFNHKSFIFERNHFLYSAFNTKITQLVESGIAKKIISDFGNDYEIERAQAPGPAVLSLAHLGVGFLVCLFFLLISFLCFGFEILFRLCENHLKFS